MYVLTYVLLIDFGHDCASFVVILLFDKNGYGFIKRDADPISYTMGVGSEPTPPPFHRPGTQGDISSNTRPFQRYE
jgi:hypothetical protein